jgi:hypothetical protein
VEFGVITKSLPTFKHDKIGAKTQKPGTATAHLSYIMRADALTCFQAENMPQGERGTRNFFDKLWENAGSPANHRICDKLMIALPRELSQDQRFEVVRSFMQELGEGRIPWCAAHHDDPDNPHAHIAFKDADVTTGRKVVGTTTCERDVREAEERGWKVPPRTTTADMRQMWCEHLNQFMERAGLDIRYDPRTLKEQGIERQPQIHIGPKAQALDEKGYDFTSQDRTRGAKTIPYTLFDEASRAVHNDHLREAILQAKQAQGEERANGEQKPKVLTPEQIERRTLRDAQKLARKTMFENQQKDRDALRLAQEPAKIAHRLWAKKLYRGARSKAFQAIKTQYDPKWREVRAIKNLQDRQDAAAALKIEQKKAYDLEATRQVNACRPEKDAAWKAMDAVHEKERLDLQTAHRAETIALSRQHVAERLGVIEKWRAFYLGRHANAIDAQLSARQGMAAQQKAAVSTIKLHNRAGKGDPQLSANPREAARRYFEIAREEDAKKEKLREALSKQRDENLKRAAIAAGRRLTASLGRGQSRSPAPREIIVPGIDAARSRRGADMRQRRQQPDQQQTIRQAVESGRTLSGDERANASPELRERSSREERIAKQRAFLITHRSKPQNRENEGRGGGGRGR